MKHLALIALIACGYIHAANKVGTLSIDKKVVAQNFVLEPVFHTMEVKPEGTVLDTYCGTPEEMNGTKVCVASTTGRPNVYYVVLHETNGDNVFARAGLTILKKIPPIYVYSGFAVTPNPIFPRYQTERFYELELHD